MRLQGDGLREFIPLPRRRITLWFMFRRRASYKRRPRGVRLLSPLLTLDRSHMDTTVIRGLTAEVNLSFE